MKVILTLVLALMTFLSAGAYKYTYSFNNTTISQAILRICKDHPDEKIAFIYKELDNYRTSAKIRTNDTYSALLQTVGINPVSVVKNGKEYYIEALQHGRFIYRGQAVGSDNLPVSAATVMLLAPNDSTVLTYGIADGEGRFSIPCDRRNVIAKLSSIGYLTTLRNCTDFNCGTIVMPVNSILLKQVKVEGQSQRVIDRGVEYTPSNRAKKAAIDATNLLMLMNIPQLDINPGSTSVKTYTGNNVSLFIDYVEATSADLQGLRPEDVSRVEVLQYPEDPRFKGAANVVNFIMRRYEWGGYTKLNAQGSTLSNDYGQALLYSKFVRKNWTFDANATGSISHNNKDCSHNTETFHDIYVGDRHFDELTRTVDSKDNNLTLRNSQHAGLRGIYATKTGQIIHSAWFNRTGIPIERKHSEISYSDDVLSPASALSKESRQTISAGLTGNYYFVFPAGHTLEANFSFTYGKIHRDFSYRPDAAQSIINNNREASYAPNAIIQYSKKFSHNNTFRTSLLSFNSIYHTDYAGSYNGLQKLLSSENMLFLEYMQNWKCGLSLYSRLGVSYVLGRVNGKNELEQWNPRLGLQLNYMINDRHSASIEGWWGNNHPTPSHSNSAIVQSDELLWLQGNPGLRNTTFISASASYNYVPDNKLSLSVTADYNGYLDKMTYSYSSLAGHDGLVRKEINSGDYHAISGYLSGSLRLFDKSLSLIASGKASYVRTSGIDAQSMGILSASVQANYYYRNFSFSLYYQTPSKNLSAFNDGFSYRFKSSYGAYVNYSAGDFKAKLEFHKWFDNDRYYLDFDSRRYSSHGWEWQGGHFVSLTLSYTIPYGKKVHRDNEISTSNEAGSAILK